MSSGMIVRRSIGSTAITRAADPSFHRKEQVEIHPLANAQGLQQIVHLCHPVMDRRGTDGLKESPGISPAFFRFQAVPGHI